MMGVVRIFDLLPIFMHKTTGVTLIKQMDVTNEEMESAEEHPPTAHIPKELRTRYKYNIFCRILFIWLDPLFWIGCHRRLIPEDLGVHPSEVDSKMLLKNFNRYWSVELERVKRGQKARLWLTVLKCNWLRLTIQAVVIFTEISLYVAQSLVLGNLTDYFTLDSPTGEETRNAYLYAAALVTMTTIVIPLHAHGSLLGQKIGMISRIIMTSAVYQKMLVLSQVTIGQVSIGHVVNLVSNDVKRFETRSYLQYLWISPLHLIVFTYLVYQEVAWSAFLATGFIILQLPIQILMARAFSYFRFKSAKVTDSRIRIMNEVITGIRVIKMYAWEYAFKRVVSALRRLESTLIFKGGSLLSAVLTFNIGVANSCLMAITFLSYTAAGGELTPRKIFVTLSLIDVVRRTNFHYIVQSIFFVSEIRVAFVRLQKFLLLEEVCHFSVGKQQYPKSPAMTLSTSTDEKFGQNFSREGYFRSQSPYLIGSKFMGENSSQRKHNTSSSPNASDSTSTISITMDNVSASWSSGNDKMVLSDIEFEVNKEFPLLAIVGPVGAGKSTLLQILLRELQPVSGKVDVSGKLSYASQEPWVFSGTIQENILFGLPMDSKRYHMVLEACSLDKDIAMLNNGDLTLVGERGVTLSGGQKARVNLARAIYYDADIYLLDDPLSAVDTSVAKQLFDECIQGLLRDKLVVLVTHQVQFALQADKLLVLNEGKVHMYGTHAELEEKGVNTTQLLGLIKTEEDEEDREFEYDDEESDSGEEEDSIFVMVTPASSMISINSISKHNEGVSDSEVQAHQALPEEEKAHGSVSTKTYYNFLRAGGNYIFLLVLATFFIMAEGNIVVADWWISDWADCSVSNYSIRSTCDLSTNDRIIIYSSTTGTLVILNLVRGILLYFLCINAARVLHNRMFTAVLRAPFLFFGTNPSGRILNRFSKDIGYLDDLLPQTLLEFLVLTTRFTAIIVTASIANVYILVPAALIIVVFFILRWYFLKTAREVKRLEAISRSPLYSHVSLTLQGLPTIRSFGREHINTALEQLHRYQNRHSQGWYLNLVLTRWFGIRIDILGAIFVASVAFFSVPLSSQLSASLVGLGLTYSISLSDMLQYCVRQSAEVENIMISTERIMGYSRLEPEASLETLPPNDKPPSDWPDKGKITFEDVAFQYSPNLPLVLKNLCVTIKPSEKVGIVGRTGAGKSSLISVLYRLAEPFGVITIDGVDSKSIGLHNLRKKISIIPQDPILFSGTVRYNLDPFDEYSDAELWNALEQVQLKMVVQQLEGQLGSEVSEGGSNFSVGQRQLVCLARALLRKNKILVLDEATANVDHRTDEIIQMAIREKFSKCTVLTIAHRLNTIMDSDRILVMSKGQVKEFDTPYRLLQNSNSQFYKMVEKTGPTASQKLHQMAVAGRLLKRRRSSVRSI